MFSFNSIDIELMGQVLTFDAVTVYGLLCGAVFTFGFFAATAYEQRRAMQVARQTGCE